ncbi:MAG TPA: AAA family ATPase [Vicinamibacterales bacterium]|nr:AAA family ATPase [Vicinamibacterales bacterium]
MDPFLTYEPFFGLQEKPFSLASDPAFFYNSASHRAAFEALDAGIRRREGLIVLSGEIGTGKTTLCRTVLSQLDRKTFSTFVPDPFVTREDLLKMLLVGFGVASVADIKGGRLQGASRQDLSYPLYEFLDSLVPLQAFAVLVIDEAQNLSLGVMEEIRILAELEKREKLLQVVLVGQPELRDNLRLPQMRQVEQRVTVRCELAPLAFREVSEYVQHRLRVAAVANPARSAGEQTLGVEFTGGAVEAVHLASGGVPRLINRVCDRALQRGFDARRKTIDRDLVSAAVRDLGLDERRTGADVAADDMLPLPFEPALETAPAVRPGTPAAMAATPPPAPRREPAGGTSAFEPETPPAPRPEPKNPLSEFDSEPEGSNEAPGEHRSAAAQTKLPTRGVAWTLTRALGLAAVALVIAAGTGVLDARAVFGVIAPDVPAELPELPSREASLAQTALPVPDALSVAFTDARAHEPDVYAAQAATFGNRAAADALVAELTAQGFRARWAEVSDGTDAVQQVFVDGYGTLEDALALVRRLRGRASTAGTLLFRLPGAVNRQDFSAR